MNGVPAADRLEALDVTAQLYLELADWTKGLEYLLQVNGLQGGRNMETLFRIAFSYSQLRQIAQAIPYMEQALAVGGEQAGETYYSNMAVLYVQAERYDEAIETYVKLLDVAPNTVNREAVSAELAALYIKVGNEARAKITLEGLIRAFPSSPRRADYMQSLAALNATTR
jgi:tetratricopeptide (TPR) repeat protein